MLLRFFFPLKASHLKRRTFSAPTRQVGYCNNASHQSEQLAFEQKNCVIPVDNLRNSGV